MTGIIREIKENPAWSQYLPDVIKFRQYLRDTESLFFRVYCEKQPCYETQGQKEDNSYDIPYHHRWSALYRSGILAKFYKLEDYLKLHPSEVTMMTLTTYHGYQLSGKESELSLSKFHHLVTIEESFNLLKEGWNKIRQCLRGYDYIWIMEPHKTGYPHYHVVILGKISQFMKDRINYLWSKKYDIASDQVGVKFTSPPVKSIRNYLVKYMAKGWTATSGNYDKQIPWKTGWIVFNSLVKKNKWRLFGSSKTLTAVMRYDKSEKEENSGKKVYYATELYSPGKPANLVWALRVPTGWKNYTRVYKEIEKIPFPDLPDPFGLANNYKDISDNHNQELGLC